VVLAAVVLVVQQEVTHQTTKTLMVALECLAILMAQRQVGLAVAVGV
jgi:hypothetical protein